ncbi:DUF2380 domain-containing protein [Aurantimonas marina]|uniref:DUF2380 domain-containing protein n=1 Tax=Aurantimonas marina TaxID=2780508 RepID=UPI0019D30DDC|nr:DUF2380 domain-containing protein [Aurantimonas marina]
MASLNRAKSLPSIIVAMTTLFAAPAFADSIRTIAVIGFDYSDSSGEPADQAKEHMARLALFREEIRNRVDRDASFKTIELPCTERSRCSRGSTSADLLLREARAAGAHFLVFGSIHKMSTLVGAGRVDVLDVATDRILLDRVLSFRGDTDEAFKRAAAFAAKDILRTLNANSGEDGMADDGRGAR